MKAKGTFPVGLLWGFFALNLVFAPLAAAVPCVAGDWPASSCNGTEACCSATVDIAGYSCNADKACKNKDVGDVGSRSCEGGNNACRSGATVGYAACLGSNACAMSDDNNDPWDVGARACHGDEACHQKHIGNVGYGACIGDDACLQSEADIGDRSCMGQDACHGADGSVDYYSCAGSHACKDSEGNIGSRSCTTMDPGGYGVCLGSFADIGYGSCNGPDGTCELAKGGSIDDRSCNGEDACRGSIVDIGYGSCNGKDACRCRYSAPVGDHECNGDGACQEECPKTFFVSSARFDNGNLVGAANAAPYYCSKTDGVKAGDCICQWLADASAKVPDGTYKAWLSETGHSPSTDWTQPTVPYIRVDGVPIATNWAALVGGTLLAPPNVDELGSSTSPGSAWTGTDGFGVGTPDNCNGWVDMSASYVGEFGGPTETNSDWTYHGTLHCESASLRIYCGAQ